MKKTVVGIIGMALAITSQAALFETDMGSSAVTGVTATDLENVSSGGSWGILMNNINTTNIVGNAGGTDYALLVDEGGAGGNSQWTSATVLLDDAPHNFSSGGPIEVQFDMAYSRSGGNKKLSMIGFGTGTTANTTVFRLDWNLGGTVALTASGDGETLDFGNVAAFASATNPYDSSKLKTFNVTMDGTTLTYGVDGSSQSTTVLNSQVQLSSIRWAITGTGNGANQGFWLDNVTVIPEPATLGLIASTGVGVLFIRRRLMM